eukprot:7334779-Pyramimonas_sp.AAC.1
MSKHGDDLLHCREQLAPVRNPKLGEDGWERISNQQSDHFVNFSITCGTYGSSQGDNNSFPCAALNMHAVTKPPNICKTE